MRDENKARAVFVDRIPPDGDTCAGIPLRPARIRASAEGLRLLGFLTGFRHPISGLDHVLAMVAVGLWGAQLGSPAIWVLPVAFPLVMAFGGMLGLLGVPILGIEYGIAASAILLGAAVMFEVRPPLAVAATLVGIFAIFHGYAHGTRTAVCVSVEGRRIFQQALRVDAPQTSRRTEQNGGRSNIILDAENRHA